MAGNIESMKDRRNGDNLEIKFIKHLNELYDFT